MTVVILCPLGIEAQPWGWWDEDDSIARPLPVRDSLSRKEGRLRLSTQATERMDRTRFDYDASGRVDSWQATVSGRDDSGVAPTRQRASWTRYGTSVQVGDLVPWNDAPLLEGGARRSGDGHPLRHLGSGNAVAGIDADVVDEWLAPWPVGVRSRVSSSPEGSTRSSVMASLGPFRSGVTTKEGSALLGSAGLVLDNGGSRLDASLIADRNRRGFFLEAGSNGEASRHRIEIRHVDADLVHDGLPSGWSGAMGATAESRWIFESTSLGASGIVEEDSSGIRRTRLLGDVSDSRFGFDERLRYRWLDGPSGRSLRVTPGLSRASGALRPWVEAPWTRGEGVAPSMGVRWIGRDLQAEASATRDVDGIWRWRVASSLGRTRRGGASRLEIALSGDHVAQQGGGSWSTSW